MATFKPAARCDECGAESDQEGTLTSMNPPPP